MMVNQKTIRRVGAHVSIAKSLDLAVDRAKDIGANCLQIFGRSPRSWRPANHSQQAIKDFKEKATRFDIQPIFIHGSYLLNLAGTQAVLQKSIASLKKDLDLANQLGGQGVIFHVGSHKQKGFQKFQNQIVEAIDQILDGTRPPSLLILENAAGLHGKIGSSFEELSSLINNAKDKTRLGVCLDSAHLFAAGWNLRSLKAVDQLVSDFDQKIGFEKLICLHLNDSKVSCGAGKDRHENIGEGFIGKRGLKNFVTHPVLSTLPIILEVPGFGPQQKHADEDNINRTWELLN